MPSMYVNVPRLEQETKNTLVAKLYDAAAPVLKAPHIYTFVNEYETLYENGQPAPQKMVVANIEAGPIKEEKVNAIAEDMDILIVMCIGILVGRLPLLRRMKKKNEGLSLLCTFLLIFAMGVMLGEKENFFEELSSLGFTSFLFFLLPTGFSIILVYYLTKVFMKKEKNSEEREEAK